MNKARILRIILLCFVIYGTESYSQPGALREEKSGPVKHYWGDIDGFLNRQAEVMLELVRKALVHFPPALPEPFERRMALLMIDGVLHDEAAPQRLAVQEFFHSRMELVLKGLTEDHVEKGAMIWKLYNHGFMRQELSIQSKRGAYPAYHCLSRLTIESSHCREDDCLVPWFIT